MFVLALSAAGLADDAIAAMAPLALLPFVVWIVAVSIGMIRRPSPVASVGVATVGV